MLLPQTMPPSARTLVLITAAGRGSRAGEGLPKQWRMLAGKPVLAHSVAAFAGLPLVVTIHPEDRARAEACLPGVTLIEGGGTRAESVRNALEAMQDQGYDRVLIHDGARPLVSPALIARLIEALDHGPAAAPGLAVTDALWRGEADQVAGLAPREGLYRAQTPQAFHFDAILAAHRADPSGEAADDVALARAAGLAVTITEGEEDNLKLTWPGDFARAEAILARRKGAEAMDIRMGNGYDVHAFTEGNQLWLCGISVPHDKGLLGHSDADVGMHALTDAIYGALAEGDIGRHFPPSDPQWKGAASDIFLDHAVKLAASRGYSIGNCDVTLVCERPKIGPHAAAMQARLAEIIGCEPGRVSVKATTSERLGFTGREEGIASIATVVLVQK